MRNVAKDLALKGNLQSKLECLRILHGFLWCHKLSQQVSKSNKVPSCFACITVRLRALRANTFRFAAGLGMPRRAPRRRSGTRSGCPLKAKKETGKERERSSEKEFVSELPLARSLLRHGKGEHRQQSRRARTVLSSEGTTPFLNAWTPRCSHPCSPCVSEGPAGVSDFNGLFERASALRIDPVQLRVTRLRRRRAAVGHASMAEGLGASGSCHEASGLGAPPCPREGACRKGSRPDLCQLVGRVDYAGATSAGRHRTFALCCERSGMGTSWPEP